MFRSITNFAVAVAFIFVAAGCQTTPGENLSDTGITTQVKTRLAADGLSGVGVETVRGTVYLTGVVKSAEDKRRAGENARTAESVIEVVNNLQIRTQ